MEASERPAPEPAPAPELEPSRRSDNLCHLCFCFNFFLSSLSSLYSHRCRRFRPCFVNLPFSLYSFFYKTFLCIKWASIWAVFSHFFPLGAAVHCMVWGGYTGCLLTSCRLMAYWVFKWIASILFFFCFFCQFSHLAGAFFVFKDEVSYRSFAFFMSFLRRLAKSECTSFSYTQLQVGRKLYQLCIKKVGPSSKTANSRKCI